VDREAQTHECSETSTNQPKWIEKQKTSTTTSLAASPLAITGANDIQPIESAHERPAGKKKEK
jgi:hypothetical protein